MTDSIVIREIKTMEGLAAAEDLQKQVWGFADREIVPASLLRAGREVGVFTVGAYDQDRLVGFACAFPGFEDGRRVYHSDMAGVVEGYRDRGLGYRLKMAQRERALAAGVAEITWTFDPLQARNGWFNFHKLGAIADRYIVDFYGNAGSSPLHSTGTDRLWIRWLLHAERSSAPADRRIEVPLDFDAMRRGNPELAWDWRRRSRESFQDAMAAGLTVVDFVREDGRGIYLLSRDRPQSPGSE